MEHKQDNNSLSHSQPTPKAPTEAENVAFIALFEQFYVPGLFSNQWGEDLSVLRQAPNPRALAENHNGRHTREAMVKVRNAEAEIQSLAGQVQLDTPLQGDCLFWAVMLGVLIRAKDTDRFEAVVSDLFGEEPTPVNANQLGMELWSNYQGCVSDITSIGTEHHFHALMMRFRARVAKRIAETKELHQYIEDDVETYCEKMSTAGTWGGEIEIKAMATLLGMDIIVHRDPGSPMHRMPAVVGRETEEALHIAHVPAASGSPANNHYHFLVPKSHAYWLGNNDNNEEKEPSMAPSLIEALVRASVAEYNTWWMYNYLEMDFLVKLLKSRRAGMPRDISFENKVLWALVHSNENYREVKADPSQNYELIRLFLIKYNRGDQDLFDFQKGKSAKFPGALRGLLMPLAGDLEVHTNFPCLRQMDKDATSHMLPFLTTQEQVFLFSTCKALRERNSVFIKPINKLLYLVARGEQNKAEAMIKKSPELLLQSGDITDGAGRYFKGITPLQYAVWALDAHMWMMMLPLFLEAVNIDQDGYWFTVAAAYQLQVLEKKGTAHGRHFDFKPLLDAYEAFLANPSDETWCRGVGGAQLLLPDHVVQEYTTQGRSFRPTATYWRSEDGRHWRGVPGPRWWREAVYEDGRMGQTWAALRSTCYSAGPIAEPEDPNRPIPRGTKHEREDYQAVQVLFERRYNQRNNLLRRYGVEPSPAAESKSPGPGR